MIADLKPYPAMKDSGVPWLGEVPEHWEVKRAKTLFGTVDIRSESGTEELLTVSSNLGVIPRRSANVTMFKAESYAGHKLCWPGDLVINSLWAWSRGLGVSRHHGIVSTAYGVYRARDTGVLDPGFVHELVRSTLFHWELRVRSKGVWTSRLQLTDESFLGAPLPLPPLPEQAAIVRFLDHADRRVRRYIRAKQKLIKLLEEQKQAIIHHAVTRGLDPDVPLKDSGVEWLGKVPEHWNIGPLKRFVAKLPGAIKAGPFGSQLTAAEMMGSGIKVYTQRNVIDRDLDEGVNYVSEAKFQELRAFEVFPGDVLVSSRGTIGRTALVTESCKRGVLHPCLLRIQPDPARIIPEFVMALIQDSQLLPQQLKYLSNATTIDVIYSGTLANIIIPIPPVIEQNAILKEVRVKTGDIDSAIDQFKREIELLNEYRTRLITDVVTGKLDVREAAARLPDEPDEPEPPDEVDTMIDAEEEPGDDLDPTFEEAEA